MDFPFRAYSGLLPSANIVPGGIFSRCVQRLSGVCSETAFDMQRLLQVHALRQVENRRAFPTRRSPGRKNVLPHLFERAEIYAAELELRLEELRTAQQASNDAPTQ